MAFFNFIFNTLRSRVNDVQNQRFWLPGVLQNISGSNPQGKLLPIFLSNWDVGPISGEAGSTITNSFKGGYRTYLENQKQMSFNNQDVIASPGTPYPSLSFLNATVVGLENVWVIDNPPTISGPEGYQATVTLQTNYYDGSSGKPSLALFGLTGNYLLAQDLCTADKPALNKCNGNFTTSINGQGSVDLTITNAYIQADLFISVSGSGSTRSTVVTINKVSLLPAYGGKTIGLDIKKLEIVANVSDILKSIWARASKNALSSPEGQKGIFSQINNSLNQPGNLQQLSATLTPQLVTALDKMLGTVPAGQLPVDSEQQLPNPADMYLFDRIRYALNDAAGDWYLPKTVCSLSSPVVEPLNIAQVALPDQNIEGLNFTDIQLENLVFTGLSNLQAPDKQLLFTTDGLLDATVNLGGLNPPPVQAFNGKQIPAPPVKGNGIFSLRAEGMDSPITGTIAISIGLSQVHFLNQFSGPDVSALVMNLTSATITAVPAQITLNLGIDSVFSDMINGALNTDNTKNSIITKLNQEIAGQLPAISDQITKATIAGITSRLA